MFWNLFATRLDNIYNHVASDRKLDMLVIAIALFIVGIAGLVWQFWPKH
jgi:hypothetical protein